MKKTNRFLSLLLAVVMIVGMISHIEFTAQAAVANYDETQKLGRGFYALGGVDLNNISANLKSNPILEEFRAETSDDEKSRSNYLYSSTAEDFSKVYTNSKTVSLNASIPIKTATVSLKAEFGDSFESNYTSSKKNLLELYYSESVTKKAEIIGLGGVTGAREHLTSDFSKRLTDIENATDETRNNLIDDLFNVYGTHAVVSVYLGGILEVANHVYSATETSIETLKNNSSLSGGVGVGKVFNVSAGYSQENSTITTNSSTWQEQTRAIHSYGATYSGTDLTEEKFATWQASLKNKSYIISFVDRNSLIPVWELTDNVTLREYISSRYYIRLAQASGFDLDSYIYQSPNAGEYSVVSVSDRNEVAPGSTVYFSLPYENATISLSGNSGSFASIDNASYGSVRFKSGVADGQVVTVDFKIGDELIPNSSITFITRTEGKFGNNTYFAGGYGTAERPYLIATAAQLHNLQSFCGEDYADFHYKLISDIDLGGGFEPIDTFYGTLDGNDKTIKNWTFNKNYQSEIFDSYFTTCYGLIRENFGVVKNITLLNIKIRLNYLNVDKIRELYLGALCGQNYGIINKCYITQSKIEGYAGADTDVDRKAYIGGLCGECPSGSITQCGAYKNIFYAYGTTKGCTSETRCGSVIGSVFSGDDPSQLTDLFAYDNTIYCDGKGGTSGDTFLSIGWWSGTVWVDVGGIIGRVANIKEFTRLISVNNTINNYSHYVENNGRYINGVINDRYHYYSSKWYSRNEECSAKSRLSFDSLSDIMLDSTYKSYDWRQNVETGELYFAKDSKEAPESTAFPFVRSVTPNSIQMLDLPLFEYKIDDQDWAGKVDFAGLAPNTTHYIYTRYAETNTSEAGAQSNAIIVTTLKESASAPSVPVTTNITDTTVMLKSVSGCEYSIDGIHWQENPVFSGLSPYTQYTFYQRYAETETDYASESSVGLTVATDKSTPETPNAPTVDIYDDTTVTLKAVDGYEYSKNGITWQSSNIFTGLSPVTPYTFYQRVEAKYDSYASASSTGAEIITLKASVNTSVQKSVVLSCTDTSITLQQVSGYEYSIDGGETWQDEPSFDGLLPFMEYTFCQRVKETATSFAGVTSDSVVAKTDKSTPTAPSTPTAKKITATSVELYAVTNCEYSIDGIHWQAETVFDGLSAATEYSFYQRIIAGATSYPSNTSNALTVRTEKSINEDIPNAPSLLRKTATTVMLKSVSDAEFKCGNGAWQTSNIFTGLTPNTEYRFYVRYAETDTALSSAASPALYVVTDKEAALAPGAPTAKNVTAVSVTLNAIENGEYSIDGVTWQNEPIFTGLSPATQYSFYQRIRETEEYAASSASTPISIKTDKTASAVPVAPTVREYTSDSVTLNPVNGCEYSIDGTNWQSSTYFGGLEPNTAYTFYQRVAETASVYASAPSNGTTITTDKATVAVPAAPTVDTKTANSITVTPVEGCEYRINDGAWQTNNVFTGLASGTEYVIYQRFAETNSTKASEASVGVAVITDRVISATDPQMAIGTKTARAGETVTLFFELKNAPELKSIALSNVTYDSTALELIGGEWKITDSILQNWNSANLTAAIAFADNCDVNGEIFALTFKVKDGTADGNYSVNCSITAKTKLASGAEENIAIPTISGNVNVVSVIRGDVNGDNLVTSDDAIQVLYYTLLPDIYTVNQDADFNGDGLTTSDDAIYLLYYTLLPDLYPLY